MLEQLLLNTDLRIVVFDPNADYVRINTLRDPDGAGERGAAYLNRVKDVHIFRCGDVEPGEHPLRIRFSNLPVDDQARALQLDPLKDRDEFHAFRQIVRSFGERDYDLRDVRRASAEVLTTAAHDVTLRLANLGVDEWSVWASPDGPARANLLMSPWRAAVLDVSRFAGPIERSIVALAMLRYFWAHREEREPVLIVVDEAHNLCPAILKMRFSRLPRI